MNESISNFILNQKCASVCCLDGKNPYCFSCYYAFDAKKGLLYFKSSEDTTHIKLLTRFPEVAGTILPDKLQTLIVQGIQFEGTCLTHGPSNEGYVK